LKAEISFRFCTFKRIGKQKVFHGVIFQDALKAGLCWEPIVKENWKKQRAIHFNYHSEWNEQTVDDLVENKNTLKELRAYSMVVSANSSCAVTDNLKIFVGFGALGSLEYHRFQSATFHYGALRNIQYIES